MCAVGGSSSPRPWRGATRASGFVLLHEGSRGWQEILKAGEAGGGGEFTLTLWSATCLEEWREGKIVINQLLFAAFRAISCYCLPSQHRGPSNSAWPSLTCNGSPIIWRRGPLQPYLERLLTEPGTFCLQCICGRYSTPELQLSLCAARCRESS